MYVAAGTRRQGRPSRRPARADVEVPVQKVGAFGVGQTLRRESRRLANETLLLPDEKVE